MKKNILPILQLIFPYLYILFLILTRDNSSNVWLRILSAYGLIVVGIFIPNMIYAFILAAKKESSSQLLFWAMLLKLCNIPIYIFIFMFGTLAAILPLGFLLIPFLVIFDYIMLLPSTMYGISGIIQARREGKITIETAVINGILHFFFCLDVISAIIMFRKVKSIAKNQNTISTNLDECSF